LQPFPKHERFDLSTQMSKCSISMPAILQEGSGRMTKALKKTSLIIL